MELGDSWRRVHRGRRYVESWVHLSCSSNEPYGREKSEYLSHENMGTS